MRSAPYKRTAASIDRGPNELQSTNTLARRKRDDGKYAVALTVEAKKLRADGQGVETEVPLDDWIEIGVFGEAEAGGAGRDGGAEGSVLHLEKRRLTEPRSTFELVVDAEPSEAGIDPYNKLIDRNSDDNRTKVGAAG